MAARGGADDASAIHRLRAFVDDPEFKTAFHSTSPFDIAKRLHPLKSRYTDVSRFGDRACPIVSPSENRDSSLLNVFGGDSYRRSALALPLLILSTFRRTRPHATLRWVLEPVFGTARAVDLFLNRTTSPGAELGLVRMEGGGCWFDYNLDDSLHAQTGWSLRAWHEVTIAACLTADWAMRHLGSAPFSSRHSAIFRHLRWINVGAGLLDRDGAVLTGPFGALQDFLSEDRSEEWTRAKLAAFGMVAHDSPASRDAGLNECLRLRLWIIHTAGECTLKCQSAAHPNAGRNR